jgi:alkylhydroperoxidase domain protein
MTTSSAITPDLLDSLAEIPPDSPLAAARKTRDQATRHIQGSYMALFDRHDGTDFTLTERLTVARQVADWHQDSRLAQHYADRHHNPSSATVAADTRLRAALVHAERLTLRPVSATPAHLDELHRAGWSLDNIVTLSQLVAYVSFQSRLLRGYRLIAGQPVETARQGVAASAATLGGRRAPPVFTQQELGWEPWIAAKKLSDYSASQQAVLEKNGHADSDYFRLLGRNLPVLEQRTLTDKGIFYTAGGLTRKERELAAAVASKINGCIYCASVHARKAAQLSKQTADIERLLGTPPGDILSEGQAPRWQAEIDFAAALSITPPAAAPRHLLRLRELGLTDLELLDLVQATAFFAWANRLMLTLGEPYEH